jgi:hypothetical protein
MAKAKRKARRQFAIEPLDLPTPEQLKSAPYVRDFVTHAETNTKATAHRCYRDPVLRWERDGKITDMQASTIRRMQGLWEAVYGTQKLVATYGEQLARSTGETSDLRLMGLTDDLRRIEGYFDGLRQWYSTFERVCRFGQTGPEACVTDAVSERASRDRALVVVCFIADYIRMRERW